MAVNRPRPTQQRQSFVSIGIVKRAFVLLSVLVIALMVSIVSEWIGLVYVWPEQGLDHSAQMIERERAYLRAATHENVTIDDPEKPVYQIMRAVNRWQQSDTLVSVLRFNNEWMILALFSAINIIHVFLLRLMVMALSTPAFVVFGLVGLVRGLVAREIRRWGVGRESSGMYGLYMRLLPESFVGLWFIYLSMPVTINPFAVVGPAAILFSILIANTSYRFKKYK